MIFHKYETIGSGDIYYTTNDPVFKEIEGVRYVEATPDFHRVNFVRFDMLKYVGREDRAVH